MTSSIVNQQENDMELVKKRANLAKLDSIAQSSGEAPYSVSSETLHYATVLLDNVLCIQPDNVRVASNDIIEFVYLNSDDSELIIRLEKHGISIIQQCRLVQEKNINYYVDRFVNGVW